MKYRKIDLVKPNVVEMPGDNFPDRIQHPINTIIRNQHSPINLENEQACLNGLESIFIIHSSPGYAANVEVLEFSFSNEEAEFLNILPRGMEGSKRSCFSKGN